MVKSALAQPASWFGRSERDHSTSVTSRTSLQPNDSAEIISRLAGANQEFMRCYPGESDRRQAVQTVYGGAHLFRADTARRLGDVAMQSLTEYAPDPRTLGEALGVSIDESLAHKIYERILEKLRREPV